MIWKHNLVAPDGRPFICLGRAVTESPSGYRMWFSELCMGHSWSMAFTQDGTVGNTKKVLDVMFDSLFPYSGGNLLVTYAAGASKLFGIGHNDTSSWNTIIQQADSRRWGLVEDAPDSLLVAYNSRNPVDGHTQAHIARITPSMGENTPLISLPDDDYANVLVMVPLVDRFALCLRNRGAGVLYHIMGFDGATISTGSFAPHPHSRWAIPDCYLALPQGETLLGGWQEKKPGYREPWVARLDADFNVLYGQTLPALHGGSAVTCLGRSGDGHIYALCPPSTIYRLSPKGFLLSCWHVPAGLSNNAISAIYATKAGACLITGRSLTTDNKSAGWLAAIDQDEFVPLEP